MMKMVVGGVETSAPAFTEYEVTFNPQQKSAERNGNGKLIRETLPDKWSLQMTWEFSTPEAFYAWFSYLKALTQIDFTVKFPAPTGAIEESIFYVSPISARMLNFSRGTSGWWKSLKCTFVEV